MLGEFNLEGIPPAPRGVPQVEVTFDIDANGIVHVQAKDKATNKEQKIVIQASGGLSEADIEKMVRDAEANAADDKKRRELVEAKNSADSLIYSTEKSLNEYGSKISAGEKDVIEKAAADLKAVIDGEDAESIKAKTNELSQAAMKLGEAMYKAQQETAGSASSGDSEAPNASNPDNASDEKVVDATFEEVDGEDKKKAS
jgi:molecular chaperone DnaK